MIDDNLTVVGDLRPARADAVKNRALLLATAKRLFAEQGVEVVCMATIAEAAGVGKGTLYRHFKNKTELCLALLDEDQRDLQTRTLTHLRSSNDPLESLQWFIHEVLAFVERNSAFMRVHDHQMSSLQLPAHAWWHQTFHGLLERLSPSGDLDYLADLLYIMLDVNTVYFQRYVRGYSLERIADGLLYAVNRFLN